MKAAQREVKLCLKEAKDFYRTKLEQKLRNNSIRGCLVWHQDHHRTLQGWKRAASEPQSSVYDPSCFLSATVQLENHSEMPWLSTDSTEHR